MAKHGDTAKSPTKLTAKNKEKAAVVTAEASGRATEEEFLKDYDPSIYKRPSVTADVVLFTIRQGRLAVLLVQRADHPFKGAWALPGGFLEPGETAEEAARRELCEESGITNIDHLEQLKSYDAPGRDPRTWVITIAHVGMMPDLPTPTPGSDAALARWWAVEDLGLDGIPGLSLAFDHAQVIEDGLERVRAKLEYTSLATSFVTAPFTIGDLRHVYEVVWGKALHQANFRRKVLSSKGFIEPTGEKAMRKGPAAELFTKGPATELTPPLKRD